MFSFLHQEYSWWLVWLQGHSQILSCSHGEPIFLEGGDIKAGSGLGMTLATNYTPYEEVMKILSHCLETCLHRMHQYRRIKLRSVRLLCKMRGETDSQEILLSNLKQVAILQCTSITCTLHNHDYSRI